MHVRSYQGEGFLPVKWRGAALAEFDGKRWFNPPGQEQVMQVDNGEVVVRSATEGARRGPNLIYQVHLEPLIADTLFFAGTVETIKIDVRYLRYSRGGGFHVSPRLRKSRTELQRVWIPAERVGSGTLYRAASAGRCCASC